MILHGNQNHHAILRKSVAQHMRENFASIFENVQDIYNTSNMVLASEYANELGRCGSWVGEEGLLAMANYLNTQIKVFVASLHESPLTYPAISPPSTSAPILLAFYEPGHFRPVFRHNDSSSNSPLECSMTDVHLCKLN